MSISVTYEMKVSVRETLESGIDGANSPSINFTKLNVEERLNANTLIPASAHVQDIVALVSGAKTIDLTNLVATGGGPLDGTGKKIQVIRIRNNGSGVLTIGKGATNGYALWTDWSMPIYPGCTWEEDFRGQAPAIDATHKTIDVAGTGTETFDFSIVLG